MINNKAVIIIGAGGSSEVGLPVGEKLKSEITKLLDFDFDMLSSQQKGDTAIIDAVRRHIQIRNLNYSVEPYIYASQKIRNAMPQAISIDNYLDAHKENGLIELCGKLSIARAILKAERKSNLYIDPHRHHSSFKFKSIENTWFTKFFKLITEDCRKEELEERLSGFSLVIFNYDRCIEHFLFYALQNYYDDLDAAEAARLVSNMEIYHPYGSVGDLPWYGNRIPTYFGEEVLGDKLLALSSQIKTFTEGTDPESSDIESISQHIVTSNLLLFIGFAFHNINMKLLTDKIDKEIGRSVDSVIATAYGISDNDCTLIQNRLIKSFNVNEDNVHIRNDLSAASIFHEYWRTLSLYG